jgi:2,5-diketo-D-gluconate reductase B
MSKTLTKSGLTIPLIGLGTGSGNLRGRKCRKVVRKALELGYRHIDTAAMYENEADVGKGIVDSSIDRKEIFLTTKINTTEVNNEGIVDVFHKSLSDLKTDYVDLLLIHWPTFSTNLGDMLEIMYGIKESQKARVIGVANFNTTLLNECSRLGFEDIYCNQVEYHPFLSQEILLKKMNEMGVIPVAYCPLCRGDVAKDKVIKELSKKYNKTPAQVTLRWIIQQQSVAIPKTVKKRRLKENIDIYDFEIDDQDMNRIHNLARGKRQVPNLETNPLLGAWD